MNNQVLKQIDKAGRLTIPQDLQELSGIGSDQYVTITYDVSRHVLVVTPVSFVPQSKPQK